MQSYIQPYGMDIDLGLSGTHIFEFTRDVVSYDSESRKEDTFNIQNCFADSEETEATGELLYYVTRMYPEQDGERNGYWYPAIQKFEYDENTITFYGSFSVSNEYPITYLQENFRAYDVRTFHLTAKTRFYSHEGAYEIDYPASKSSFLECCKALNGLVLVMEVQNGEVVKATFYS